MTTSLIFAILIYFLMSAKLPGGEPGENETVRETAVVEKPEKNYQDTEKPPAQRTKRLPDVLILGLMKCGTTTLGKFLDYHPGVEAVGETVFFTNDQLYARGPEFYASQMKPARPDQLVLANSPQIFYHHDIPGVLRRHTDTLPDVKVMLIVKDPIPRTVSHIVHNYANGGAWWQHHERPEIDEVLLDRADPIIAMQVAGRDIVLQDVVWRLSNYSHIYNQVAAAFPAENILVLNGNTLVEDPLTEIRKVETFLGLAQFYSEDHFIYPDSKKGFPCFALAEGAKCMGADKGRPHPSIRNTTKDLLKIKFRPMLEKFKEQTGIELKL